MANLPRNQVKCRPIEDKDRDGVADCLARGFPSRPRDYWIAALDRMSRRPAVDNYPRYGLLVESGERIVGVLLQIFSRREDGQRTEVICNLSSWCLDREFRGFAAMLNAKAIARKEVTYVNISAAPHTRKSIEASGFRRYCDGQFLCAPALAPPFPGKARVTVFAADAASTALLSQRELEILSEHAALGCRSLVVVADDGAHPFVFVARRIVKRLIPCLQLVYCRDMEEFSRFAGPLGRYLALRGGLLVIADANAPARGVPGYYLRDRGPKYFKGTLKPRLGDLSFSELVILGA